MNTGKCPKCGASRVNGPECPQCGVIYAKAGQEPYREKRKHQQAAPIPESWINQTNQYSIDCTACKLTGGMEKRNVARFPFFIRMIGAFIAIPSALGMVAAIMAIATPHRTPESSAFGVIIGGGFFIFSAVGGLIGWLLLMRKKALVCRRCGFLLDRA